MRHRSVQQLTFLAVCFFTFVLLSAGDPIKMKNNVLSRLVSSRRKQGLAFLLPHMDTKRGLRSRRHIQKSIFYIQGGSNGRSYHASSSPALSAANEDTRRISFLTDVEGDRDYLERFINQSKVLCLQDTKPRLGDTIDYFPYTHCIDFERPCRDILVYGGDVWDQGGSDLYAIRQLLDLKQRYPNHVYLIMGNRDVNKMRMIQELGQGDEAPSHPGVYWLRGTKKVGDPDMGLLSNDPVERLQWMLPSTMGSPRAFGHRKWELEQERRGQGQIDPVTDWDVLESYRQSCSPNGEMAQYLSQARLAVLLGEVLFIHGALPMTDSYLQEHEDIWEDLTFAMPWLDNSTCAADVGVKSVDDWVTALNDFAQSNVEGFRQGQSEGIWSRTGGYNYTIEAQPFAQLIQYGMGWVPGRIPNPTVVYSSWSINGMPRRFFPVSGNLKDNLYVNMTKSFFRRTGLSLICAGHQPQGDMPNAIRVELPDQNRTSWILSCDTSYSGDVHWHNLPGDAVNRTNNGRGDARSGRGLTAVSEVLIEQCCRSGKVLDVHCHGKLSDGTEYQTQSLDFEAACNDGDLSVGKLASGPHVPSINDSPHKGPWWTRAAFTDGSVLLAAGEGFKFYNRLIEP